MVSKQMTKNEDFFPTDLGGSKIKKKSSKQNSKRSKNKNQEETEFEESKDCFSDENDFIKGLSHPFSSKGVGDLPGHQNRLTEEAPLAPIEAEPITAAETKKLFGNIFSGLKKEDEDFGEGDGPVKENWRFCVFQLKKKKYHVFKNGINGRFNIPMDENDETMFMCVNFTEKELKSLLINKLGVNPIMFYECMLVSPIDKMFEFNGNSILYNMVINQENFDDDPLILRIIRKGNFIVIIIRQSKQDDFQLVDEIASKFKFKEVKKMKFPKLWWGK